MSEVQLPDGWVWRTLDTLGRWSGGGTPSKTQPEFWQNGTVLWVSPKDMKSKYIRDSEDKITPNAVLNSSAKYISAPALLFVVRSGILRRILPISLTLDEVTVNQDIRTLSLTSNVHPEYVYYYLDHKNRQILKTCSKAGTTVESIEPNLLKQVKVPLPPLPVQQAIVARIEELFSELEAGVKELKMALARLKTYRQAVLYQAFQGINKEVSIGDIFNLQAGVAFKKAEYSSEGVRLFQIANVGFHKTKWEEVEYLPSYYIDSYRHLILCEGDIVIALNRPLIGDNLKISQLKKDDVPAILYQRVGRLKFFREDLRLYTLYYLQSPQFISWLRSQLQGIDIPFINKSKLLSYDKFPLPEPETQNQIVSEIEAQLSEADAMETTIRQELVRAENLRQSILKQAFEGKLVARPTEQSEPAELTEVSKPASPVYRRQGDQLTLF